MSRTMHFWLVVGAYLGLMVAAATPSPLYVVYQARWHFATSTLTVVFGVYAVALLLTLLTVGGLSDYVGRRPVIVGALSLLTASMIVFACAQGVAWLFAARIMQGFAAGASIGTLSAAIVELAPPNRLRFAALLNALVPGVGLGLGALIAGAFAQYGPDPTVVVYVVVAAALALTVVLMAFAPAGDERRDGALASLTPRVRISAAVRPHFLRAVPALFAPWAQMGLTLSLLVSVVGVRFGVTNRFESGLLLVAICLASVVSGFALRDAAAHHATLIGSAGLLVGSVVTLAGLRADSLTVFAVGAAVSGLGLGGAMGGAMRTLSELPEPHERGEFFAGVYVVGYLAFAVPAVIAGFAAGHVGLVTTTYAYGIAVAATAVVVIPLGLAAQRRDGVAATAGAAAAGATAGTARVEARTVPDAPVRCSALAD